MTFLYERPLRYNLLLGLIQKEILAYIFRPQSIFLIEINNYKEEK